MHQFRRYLFLFAVLFVAGFVTLQLYQRVLAEQSGSSPESGSTSKIKTISTAVAALSYGSTAAGSWGDWGTMWNRIYSAAITGANDFTAQGGTKNGSGTSTIVAYTKALGGVDDYNNNGTIPSDTYKRTWTTCTSGNTYCGTGRSVLNSLVSQDPNTNLVWSPQISASSTWFVANNCIPPGSVGNLGYPAGTCVNNGDVSCVCVKQTGGAKTGCENYDDGLWRLPYQKELMQSYIDGSWGNLASAGYGYWSSTTFSNSTQNSWYTYQYNGYTAYSSKTNSFGVRCVR